jgi:hypothetical protein
MITMDSINWLALLNQVCTNKELHLNWRLPEPWVQAELYALLRDMGAQTGWHTIEHELPYATYFPVASPKKRDIALQGAIKWVDLALVSESRKQWCWLELKVRHTGNEGRRESADKAALNSIKQDVAALVGMNLQLTIDTWRQPDGYTASHWFEEVLKPRVESMGLYSHHFVMAYLQLFGEINPVALSTENITQQIHKWVNYKNKKSGKAIVCPPVSIDIHSGSIAGGHSLVLVQWTG